MPQWFFSKCRLVPPRYATCLSCCLCTAVFSMLSRCEEQAITNMVILEESTVPKLEYVPGSYSCPYKHIHETKSNQMAQFYWRQSQMQLVNKVTASAGTFMFLPAGLYADLYGGGPILTLSLILSAIVYILLPLAVMVDYYLFVVLLLLRTFCSGTIIPAAASIVAKCAFTNERTTFIGILSSGHSLGTIVGNLVSFQVVHWNHLFYLNSCVAFVTAIIWYWLNHSQLLKPTQDVIDIEQTSVTWSTSRSTQGLSKIPWLQVFKSWSVAILSLLAICHKLVDDSLNLLAVYLLRVLFFYLPRQMMYSGLAGDLFAATSIICVMSSSLFSDYLLTSRLLSLSTVRRLFVFIGSIVPVVLLIAASYAGCNSVIVTSCLGAMYFFKSLSKSNFYSTPLDLCSTLGGTITALTIVVANSVSELIYETITSKILSKAYGEIELWRSVYFVYGALIVISVLPYLLFPPTKEVWSLQRAPHLVTPTNSLSSTSVYTS